MGDPLTHDVSEFDPVPWLESLDGFIAIESISADPAHAEDVRKAGQWLSDRIAAVGGDAELIDWGGSPLVVGQVPASLHPDAAPTVLVYGHVDVQPAGALEDWIVPPFRATTRGEWVYGRGTADDKGHLLMLIEAVRQLVADGSLPVNVRFVCDGEEETLGGSVINYLAADHGSADACLIFDSPMLERDVPVFYVGTRGSLFVHLTVRTGAQEMHSGTFGGAALNALHALTSMLSAVLPRAGTLPAPLREGVQLTNESVWEPVERIRPGSRALIVQGARAADPAAANEFYRRTWAEPSLDVHGVIGGSPQEQRAAIPVTAEANLSMRLAPGQDPIVVAGALDRLLRDAAPEGAELELKLLSSSPPATLPIESPVIRLAQDAVQSVAGTRPLLLRAGGTLPVLSALAGRGIPTIVTGFDLPEGNIHASNERLLLRYIPLGIMTAREVLSRLGGIYGAQLETEVVPRSHMN